MQGNSAGTASGPVTPEKIQNIQLERMDTSTATATAGEPFPARNLWGQQPAVIFVVRRPGCALCREHALDLSNKQQDFAAKGVKLVGVVHEKLGVEEFSSEFFKNGEVYFDEEKAFFNGESQVNHLHHGCCAMQTFAPNGPAHSVNVAVFFRKRDSTTLIVSLCPPPVSPLRRSPPSAAAVTQCRKGLC